ncbi:MAG: extracellular solute-binding protein, partial [Candidatus Taylorbacteria bacterium]|nr:extracellular solute-binding protein [Candidatus Taylorbacteria bacterium]
MSKFQIILIAIFVICIGLGVAAFATFKGSSSEDTLPTITIWGTFPQDTFTEFVTKLNIERSTPITVNYVEIAPTNFRNEFIEELARGGGPDAILISQQEVMGYADKIITIPNTLITQRDFQNTFVSQADLYLTTDGSLALPFIVDPLVMYWNKTIFTNAGIAKYPAYWDEFASLGKKITLEDENSNIRRSAIALGEFQNVNNAREILSSLLLQAGNPITFYGSSGLQSALGDSEYAGSRSSTPSLSFFTQFADPRSSQYSWNRSLPSSKNSFLAGNLATYFGFTSELRDLRSKNPNLNFDVAPLPQIRTGPQRVTFGNMYGLSIVRSSLNIDDTFSVLQILTAPDAISILSKIAYLPSIRRDMISSSSVDPYMAIFLDGALISKGWLDT